MTNLKTIASTAAVMCFAAASFASEEVQTKMRIAVVDDRADGEIRIELDSDEIGFNLHDLQVGENRSIVGKSGQSILVTRQEDGFVFDVDGNTIEMPVFDGDHHGSEVDFISHEQHHGDGKHQVKVIRKTVEIEE